MKTRTVAGATLLAAMAIAQGAVSATTPLPKLSERKPAQFSNQPDIQIGCQAKGEPCAYTPFISEITLADGSTRDIAVCSSQTKVVHAVKLNFCPPPVAAML